MNIKYGGLQPITAIYRQQLSMLELNCMNITLYVFILSLTVVLFLWEGNYQTRRLKEMDAMFSQYFDPGDEVTRRTVDELQLKYDCCGVNGPYEWQGQIPNSCLCRVQSATCARVNGTLAHVAGCYASETQQAAVVFTCHQIYMLLLLCMFSTFLLYLLIDVARDWLRKRKARAQLQVKI